jgi:hypothetical protein
VPSDQRVRLRDQQGIPPTEQPGPEYETKSRGIIEAARLDFALGIKGQLFSKEQVLEPPKQFGNARTALESEISRHTT